MDKKELSDIVSDLHALQEKELVNNSITGKFNATIAKLILSSKHGYAERTEHSGLNGTPLLDLAAAVSEIIQRQ